MSALSVERRPVQVLIVDDDEVDRTALRRALGRTDAECEIVMAKDGIQGLEILRGGPVRERLERPYLVLLDLRMPRMTGLEMLAEIRGDDELRDSVVFMLTTSRDAGDRTEAYRWNSAGYLVKPADAREYAAVAELLARYITTAQLP